MDSDYLNFLLNLIISLAAIVAVRALLLFFKTFVQAIRWAFGIRTVILAVALAFVATIAKAPVLNAAYYLYTKYFNSISSNPAPSDVLFLQAAHAEIRKKAGDYAAEKVIAWTKHTAEQLNCKEESIYAVALLECSLNPFRIRDDKVAAGWLQFTRAGLSGMGVTLEQVISACQMRDIDFIMSLSHNYLLRKQARASVPINTEIDLYLAVFAPALIGASGEKVIYSGKNNPAYYMNKSLDGWRMTPTGIIYKQAPDGDITVEELYLAMTRRKKELISSYL